MGDSDHDVVDTPRGSANRVNLHDGVHDEIERHDVEGRVLVARDTEFIVERPAPRIDLLLFAEPGSDAARDVEGMVEDVELLVTPVERISHDDAGTVDRGLDFATDLGMPDLPFRLPLGALVRVAE